MPSAEKTESVESLKRRLEGVETAVLTEYRGLTVRQIADLRKQLKGASAEYKVVKNRLARLAMRGSVLEPLGVHLKGPIGVAFTRQDPVAVAKALHAFLRTNQALTIKVGFVEGKVLEPPALRSLADLPSKDALRSQLVGALQGPLSQLVSLLQAPQRDLVYVLEQRGAGKAGQSPAEPGPADTTPAAAASAPSESGNPVEASAAPQEAPQEAPTEAPTAAPTEVSAEASKEAQQ